MIKSIKHRNNYIHLGSISDIEVTIHNDCIRLTLKAIGVKIERSDGVVLPNFEYFPRYKKTGEELVKILRESFTTTTISVPRWLYQKKIMPGYKIHTGW